ncbi:MAG: hypothetical protein EOO40_03140, partial [Deltaproteobacteria bacterium]
MPHRRLGHSTILLLALLGCATAGRGGPPAPLPQALVEATSFAALADFGDAGPGEASVAAMVAG